VGCVHTDDLAQNSELLFPSQELQGQLASGEGRGVLPAGVHLRPVGRAGLDLTENAEHWFAHFYDDPVGYCTIGYGHLITLHTCAQAAPDVTAPYRSGLTKPEGENLLMSDLGTSEHTVMTAVRVDLTDGEFAALSDFVFNVGSANFRSSSLLQVVNAQQNDRVPGQLRRWILAKGKFLKGLELRREAEIALYLGQPQSNSPESKGLPEAGERLPSIDIEQGEH
jgi:GH24 family phage-related lysozyme (muramidase)